MRGGLRSARVSTRRSLRAAAALFALAAVLTGCRADPAETTAAGEPTAEPFRVALLSPGPVSDAGWNALAYEGLLAIRDQLPAEVAQIQTKTPAEFEEGFRDFARRGYRLVFGHGFEFQDAAATVAPDFPDSVFITTSGNTVRKNVAPLRFLLEEAAYLEGLIAAGLSKTHKIGVVGGVELPSVKSTVLAFEAGVKAAAPEAEVTSIYTGSWEDVGAGKEAALALIQRGCDVLFHNADAAGLGVFQAAQEKQVFAFGSNKNQNDIAPDVIVASAVIDIPRAMVINPRLEGQIPALTRERVAAAQVEIASGKLQVPSAEF